MRITIVRAFNAQSRSEQYLYDFAGDYRVWTFDHPVVTLFETPGKLTLGRASLGTPAQ